MTTTALADIEHRITIEASADRVWHVLTDPARVAAWLGCLQYRAEVGHLFYMQPDPARRAAGDTDGATHCEILEITPPTRLAFSWFLPGTPRTIVTLTVEARGADLSEVTLVHTGWAQFDRGQCRQSTNSCNAAGATSFCRDSGGRQWSSPPSPSAVPTDPVIGPRRFGGIIMLRW